MNAGHFVNMVHNGIDYGDMQLICEACHLMQALGMTRKEMVQEFDVWNKGVLDSFLIEIPHDFLKQVAGRMQEIASVQVATNRVTQTYPRLKGNGAGIHVTAIYLKW